MSKDVKIHISNLENSYASAERSRIHSTFTIKSLPRMPQVVSDNESKPESFESIHSSDLDEKITLKNKNVGRRSFH